MNTDKREIFVADFDSCKIAGNKSSPSKYLTPFGLINVISGKYKACTNNGNFANYDIDENTDLYCYIIIILKFLYGGNINNMEVTEFYNYLNYLDDLKISLPLLESFNRIITNGDNINPMDYIDTLTFEQIGRARKIVYERNK